LLQRFKEIYERLVSSFLLLCRILIQLFKERKLNGPPIIKEHLTNGVAPYGETLVYNFNAEGRARVRVFVKGLVDAAYASGQVNFFLQPLNHISDATNSLFPNDSAGRPDYFVYPNLASVGLVSIGSAGAFSKAIYTTSDAHTAGYRLIVSGGTKDGAGNELDVTQIYISTEVF
jgi:hypothetical protein